MGSSTLARTEPQTGPVILLGLGRLGTDVLLLAKRAVEAQQEAGQKSGPAPLYLAINFDDRGELQPGEHVKLAALTEPPRDAASGVDPTLLRGAAASPSSGPSHATFAWVSALVQEGLILARLQNLADAVTAGVTGIRRFFVVVSLADPDGVGLLLPVANLVRRYANHHGWRGLLALGALLLVPPGLDTLRQAQVAAALREIRTAEEKGWPNPAPGLVPDQSEGRQHVFNYGCYLLEAACEAGNQYASQSAHELEALAAEWLGYLAVPSIFAGLRGARLDGPARLGGAKPVFSGIGLGDYVVPVAEVSDYCSRRLAGEVVSTILLAGSAEGGLDEVASLVTSAGLLPSVLRVNLPETQPGSPLVRPFREFRDLVWHGVGSVAKAWAFRERWEQQDQPALMRDFALRVETRTADAGQRLTDQVSTVLGREPYGAFARARNFLIELGRRFMAMLCDLGHEENELDQMASRLTSRLAAEKNRILRIEASLRLLRLLHLVAVGLALGAGAGAAIADRFFASAVWYLVLGVLALGSGAAGLTLGVLLFLALRRVKDHLLRIARVLDVTRRHHIVEGVGAVLAGVSAKLGEASAILDEVKSEVAELAALPPDVPPGVLNQTHPTTGHSYVGFPGRFSLATPEMVEAVYQRGSGKERLGPVAALQTLAMDVFAPPDGLSTWIRNKPGDRAEELVSFCRQRFLDAVSETAVDLLVEKALEYGERPALRAVESVAEELTRGLLARMRPASTYPPRGSEPDLVVGLPELGHSIPKQAIDTLGLQRGLLHVIGTGLPRRVVGLSFRHGLLLEELGSWAGFEQAYKSFADRSFLHTRCVFSGQAAAGATSVPPPSPARPLTPPPLRPPGSPPRPAPTPPSTGGWTDAEDWTQVPPTTRRAGPSTPVGTPSRPSEGGGAAPSSGPPSLERCYRMLGLEPGASMDEIDDAYGDLQARYSPENGTMPDLEKMLEINEVYDRIRDSRRAQAA